MEHFCERSYKQLVIFDYLEVIFLPNYKQLWQDLLFHEPGLSSINGDSWPMGEAPLASNVAMVTPVPSELV